MRYTEYANRNSPDVRVHEAESGQLALYTLYLKHEHSQVRRSKRVLRVLCQHYHLWKAIQFTHILEVRGLDLRVDIGPFQNLVTGHA